MSGRSGTILLAARRLVDGDGHDGPAWLRVSSGRIVERGDGAAPAPADVDLGTVVPGFVDVHVHGALGTDFSTVGADPSPVVEHHARCGSTTLVASVATSTPEATRARLRELARVVHDGGIAGVHLEGPWLSRRRRGAHDPSLLRAPDRHDVARVLEAGDGTVRMVTLAPELPGAHEVIADLVAAGATVAVGHTDADADAVRRAVDAGATAVTHLFNGMPPLHHREPGPVGVALGDPRLAVEIIADGHHVADEVVDLARRAAAGRLCLVSDAMAATGLGDGRYTVGASPVVVEDGVARLADRSSLAGSTVPVGGAVARLLGRGAPVPEIVSSTSTVPARTVGLPGLGLRAGERADLVELTVDGVRRVMRGGAWLPPAS